MNNNSIFISAYAKLPKGTTAYDLYGVLILAIVLDRDTGIIEKAECSLATKVAVEFVSEHIVGHSLLEPEKLISEFESVYFGAAKKAIVSAINICYEKLQQLNSAQEIGEE
ncbi:MAG: DUF3870 domain-containing protein [Tissierellia bacterium]|nr:DUF3870 domain-containing protein [Tissierellia bacterium]